MFSALNSGLCRQDLEAAAESETPHGVPIPNSERPGRSAVYRRWGFHDQELLATLDSNVRSLHDLFELSARKRPLNRCMGIRKSNTSIKTSNDNFEWVTYSEVASRRQNFGAGLAEVHERIGHRRENHGIGIWSQNCLEWHIADLGAYSQSLYTVSLYETLGPHTIEYIINHAELPTVVCSLSHLSQLLDLAPRATTLKIVIFMGPMEHYEHLNESRVDALKGCAIQHGIQIFSVCEIEKIGIVSGRSMHPAGWNDIATINYTSGTTGTPKGVVLTHGNAVSANAAGRLSLGIKETDIHLSYLPLAHAFGRQIDQIAFAEGAAVGFYQGDTANLVEDLKILKPTYFYAVPRVLNRLNMAIRAATVEAKGLQGVISRFIIGLRITAMRAVPNKASNTYLFCDRFWTRKIRSIVGLENAHTIVSGGAYLDPNIQEFLRAALGNDLHQGWGMTESCATGTVQGAGDFCEGSVGPPMANSELCLVSVPEMGYTINDRPRPRGELLIRGPAVFQRYHKNDKASSEALEIDGWLHTGDIGEVDKLGRFKVIDRKKSILKLCQGEYVSPERIESIYTSSTDLVDVIYVHGDITKSALVAVISVHPLNFSAWAAQVLGRTLPDDPATIRAITQDLKIRSQFLNVLDGIEKKHSFNGFEKVRNIFLGVGLFTVDNDLLTPTLKLRRTQAAERFRSEIDNMYFEIKNATVKGSPAH